MAERPPVWRRAPGAGLQAAVVAIAVAGGAGYVVGSRAPREEGVEAEVSRGVMIAEVTTDAFVHATRAVAQRRWVWVDEPAVTRAIGERTVAPELAGTVASCAVEVGDPVPEDGVVARLDDARAALAKAAAEAQVALWQERIALLETQLARVEALRGMEGVSAELVDVRRSELAQARLSKRLAEAQALAAERDLTEATLRAPAGFTVLERRVEPGERIAAGQPAFVVGDLREVELRFRAAPSELDLLRRVAAGEAGSELRVEARFEDLAGEDGPLLRDARIARIWPRGEEETGRVVVEMRVENADGRLIAGLPARARVGWRSEALEVLVPRASVVRARGVPVVYALRREGASLRAAAQPVRLLADRSEGRVAVEGLEAGTLIAVGGASQLVDGREVEVVEVTREIADE